MNKRIGEVWISKDAWHDPVMRSLFVSEFLITRLLPINISSKGPQYAVHIEDERFEETGLGRVIPIYDIKWIRDKEGEPARLHSIEKVK